MTTISQRYTCKHFF